MSICVCNQDADLKANGGTANGNKVKGYNHSFWCHQYTTCTNLHSCIHIFYQHVMGPVLTGDFLEIPFLSSCIYCIFFLLDSFYHDSIFFIFLLSIINYELITLQNKNMFIDSFFDKCDLYNLQGDDDLKKKSQPVLAQFFSPILLKVLLFTLLSLKYQNCHVILNSREALTSAGIFYHLFWRMG